MNSKFILIWVLFHLLMIPVLDILYPSYENAERILPYINQGIMLIAMSIYIIQNLNIIRKTDKSRLNMVISLLWIMFIIYYAVSSYSLVADLSKIMKITMWIFGYLFFYIIAYKGILKMLSYISLFFIIIYSIKIFLYLSSPANYESNRAFAISNESYFLLFFMPMLLIVKFKFKYIVLFLIFMITLYSMKRGAMITIGFCFLSMVFTNKFGFIRKLKFGTLFQILFVLAIIVSAYIYVEKNATIYESRFSDLQGDDYERMGSGRGKLYSLPIERWYSSHIYYIAFGYGFNGVPHYLEEKIGTDFYSHSDWVLIIHDYGLLGIIIFLGFLYHLFKPLKYIPKLELPYFQALLFCAIIFFVKAIFSGSIIYPQTIYLMITIGFINGEIQRNLMMKNET